MEDIRDDIKDTDADTRDDINKDNDIRNNIVEDIDADTRDDMKRFDDIDSALTRITRAIEALANGIANGSSKVENPKPTGSQPVMKRIEDLNL